MKHVPDDPDKPISSGDDGSVEYEKADLINLPSREFPEKDTCPRESQFA